jgi:hypothetical protein
VIRFCDEDDFGFGWYDDAERMRRTSHALLVDGRVWVIDPVRGEEPLRRIRELGEPAGVVQLLDRHNRDCATVAAELGVPHLRLPEVLPPFEVIPVVRSRFWREVALFWPERRVLVVADALGTLPYFRVGEEPLGVHPVLRLKPPRQLGGHDPNHVFVGHGEGIHGPRAAPAVESALRTARRRFPTWVAGLPRRLRR